MPEPSARRPRAARLTVRYLLIAATLPYLGLKAAWLGGSEVGILDPDFAEDSGLFALNALTVLMDLVVVALAFALTTERGLRLPAWLITLPMWIGTGLLTAIAVVTPFDVIAGLVAGPDGSGDDFSGRGLPLSTWVPTLVYGGFTVQAVLLVVGFGLYAAARWPALFHARVADGTPGPTQAAQVLLARTFGALAVVLGVIRLYWAVGGTGGIGVGTAAAAHRDLAYYLTNAVFGLLAVAAGLGVVMLVDRVGGRRPLWLPVALTWFGSGTLFAWGLWQTANRVTGTALARHAVAPLSAGVDLASVVCGLLIATAATFHLVEQRQNQSFTQV